MNLLLIITTLLALGFAGVMMFLYAGLRGRAAPLQQQLTQTLTRLEELQRERDTDREEKIAALKELELSKEMQQQSAKLTEATVGDLAHNVAKKLLADYKLETETAKKQNEEVTKKTTDALTEQMLKVVQAVSSLDGQGKETQQRMAVVWQALSSPGGAGQMAEVGLENSLKKLGLEAGRDFVMQYTITGEDGGRLRPDAVIFLPQETVMVIDSKASKFVLEIAQTQNAEQEKEALERLKKTMNTHLNALAAKDYQSAITVAYKQAGRGDKIRRVLSIMCLPGDGAVEKIKQADPEFMDKVQRAGLILAGPASLAGLFALAQLEIGLARQNENQDKITSMVTDLMDNLITAMAYVEKVSKGIRAAAGGFDDFARSFNSRVLPKLKSLAALGVKPSRNKEIPPRITAYEIRMAEDAVTIEGEVELMEEHTKVVSISERKASAD